MQPWKLQPARDAGLTLGEQLISPRREAGLVATTSYLAAAAIVGTHLRLYHRLDIRGKENLPEAGPYILVANHNSHLDAIALAAAVPWKIRQQVCPIAAGDTFFSSPFVGVCSAFFINALPIWRRKTQHHAIDDLRARLIWDAPIYILFPEGTRSRTGEIAAFKSGIGMLVAETSVPVVPCRIEGTHRAWPASRWLPLPRKVSLTVGKPVTFAGLTHDRAGWETLAGQLQTAVRGLGNR